MKLSYALVPALVLLALPALSRLQSSQEAFTIRWPQEGDNYLSRVNIRPPIGPIRDDPPDRVGHRGPGIILTRMFVVTSSGFASVAPGFLAPVSILSTLSTGR